MTELSTYTSAELAHRATDGLDVTLVWMQDGGKNRLIVTVCDTREGACFEIRAEPRLALHIYYHPFAYRDFSTVDYEDSRLAA